MSLKNGRYQSEPDEIGQQVAHGRTASLAVLAALVQREAILLFQHIQQVLFLLRKGQECPFLLLGMLPYLQMYGSGQDVFIVYADVCLRLVFLVHSIDRLAHGLIDMDFQHRASFYQISLRFHLHLRLAIHLCRRLYHVDFLFGADAGYLSVVLHPYEQPSTSGIGESRDAPGYFPCVGYFEFEILVHVFAFAHQLAYILCICLNSHDGAKVGKINGNIKTHKEKTSGQQILYLENEKEWINS